MSDTKKKVLILLPGFDLGGAEKQGLYIAKSLQESGLYEVECWGFVKGSGLLVAKLEEVNIKNHVLDIPFSMFRKKRSRLKAYLKFLLRLRRSGFDVIIPFTYHCNVISASVFRFAGVKKCVWFQIAMEYHIPLSFFEKLSLWFKPVYAANSLAAGAFIAKKHGIPAEAVTFVPNPFEKSTPRNTPSFWKEKLQVGDEHIILVMSANFFPEKDHDTLVKGLKILLEKHPTLRLVFAGGLSPESSSNRVKALAFDLGLTDRVKFIGSTNDIPGLLNIAHVGILSSRSEGSPNSVIEYMGYGLPVIATDIPSISELLGKDYPYLFKVEDVDDFVAKTEHLIDNLDSMSELVHQNRQIIETRYTVETNYQAFHQLIRS